MPCTSPQERHEAIMSSCIDEVHSDYERAMKKAMLDYVLSCELLTTSQYNCISQDGQGARLY